MLCRVKTVLPPLLLIGPSVSLSEAGIPFCTAQALHFSPPHNFHFSWLRRHTHTHTHTHSETQIFMHNFSLSAPLLPRTQCLIRDYIYGEEKGKRMVKYVHMS